MNPVKESDVSQTTKDPKNTSGCIISWRSSKCCKYVHTKIQHVYVLSRARGVQSPVNPPHEGVQLAKALAHKWTSLSTEGGFMLLKGTIISHSYPPITHDIRTLSSRIGWAATINTWEDGWYLCNAIHTCTETYIFEIEQWSDSHTSPQYTGYISTLLKNITTL